MNQQRLTVSDSDPMIPSTSPSDRTAGMNFISPGLQKSPGSSPSPSEEQDSLSTENTQRLRAALSGQPEVRPAVVARGLELASDPDYPPASVLRSVADQILASPDLTEDQS
jgi:hypothetical protein